MDPTDEFLPHRLFFDVISASDAAGCDPDGILGTSVVAAKVVLPGGQFVDVNDTVGGFIELDGRMLEVEPRTEGFIDQVARVNGKLGQMCQVSFVGRNGKIYGIKASCQTGTSVQSENRIINIQWPGVTAPLMENETSVPSVTSITTISSSSFGELRPSRPYNLPAARHFESGPRLLLPESRDPEKFTSVWHPVNVSTYEQVGFQMKIQSVSILRSRFSATEDQLGVSVLVTNNLDQSITFVDKEIWWRFRFPPNCVKEIFSNSEQHEMIEKYELESVTWKEVSKGDIEAYLAENKAASVPLGISGIGTDSNNSKSFPITMPGNETIMMHFRFSIKYPAYLNIRQSWSTETRFRSHLVRRGPVLLDLQVVDVVGNKSTLTAEVSYTADPEDILPGTGKNKRGDENQVLHRCDDVFANDRVFLRITPATKNPNVTVDRPVFRIEPSDSSINPRNISEVDLRRAVLRAESTGNTEVDFVNEVKPGVYSMRATFLVDKACRRVFAVKTYIEMLAPTNNANSLIDPSLKLTRSQSISFWAVPLYGETILDSGLPNESILTINPADSIDQVPALVVSSGFYEQPIKVALSPTPKPQFEPRILPPVLPPPPQNAEAKASTNFADTARQSVYSIFSEVVVENETIDRRSSVLGTGGIGSNFSMHEMEHLLRKIIREEITSALKNEREILRTRVVEPAIIEATTKLEESTSNLVKGLMEATWTDDENRKANVIKERYETVGAVIGAFDGKWGKVFSQLNNQSNAQTASSSSNPSVQLSMNGFEFANTGDRNRTTSVNSQASSMQGMRNTNALPPSSSPNPPSPVISGPKLNQQVSTKSNTNQQQPPQFLSLNGQNSNNNNPAPYNYMKTPTHPSAQGPPDVPIQTKHYSISPPALSQGSATSTPSSPLLTPPPGLPANVMRSLSLNGNPHSRYDIQQQQQMTTPQLGFNSPSQPYMGYMANASEPALRQPPPLSTIAESVDSSSIKSSIKEKDSKVSIDESNAFFFGDNSVALGRSTSAGEKGTKKKGFRLY
ncbi:hypothetical protein HK098_003493 [Nowakowskiella sp. JEL0407]|nr:hypothetical protein HK098_003493 [Nowakowskiella sp. JEL0407]